MARFVNGPYHDMDIGHELIKRHCMPTPVSAGPQIRLFLMMPPREDWERLCTGEMSESSGPRFTYERVFVAGGVEFHFDGDSIRLKQAIGGQADPEFTQALESLPHEEKLGRELERRLAEALSKVDISVIPPGTLGAGMGYRVSQNATHTLDEATGKLTISGAVKIEVYRHEGD